MASKAAHMKLVNYGFGKGPLERQVAFPVIPRGIGHVVAINLSGLEARHKDMPVVIGAVPMRIERDDLCRLCRALVIEQQ